MKFSAPNLKNHLSQELPSLIAIKGSEDFFKQESIQQILRVRYPGQAPSEDDITRLTGSKNTSGDHIVDFFDDVNTPSLFGGERTIIIHSADFYLKVEADVWHAAIQKGWSGVVVILVCNQLDGRTKLGKLITKQGWLIECEAPFNRPPPWKPQAKPWHNPLNEWLVARARQLERRLDPPTAHLLINRVGSSLSDIAAMLDRMVTVTEKGSSIARELVELHVPDGEESNIFEVVDAMFSGDRARTFELVKDLLRRGSKGTGGERVTEASGLLLMFIASSMSRVRQIRNIHRVLESGGNDEALINEAGVKKFLLPKLKKQARSIRPQQLRKLVDEFGRADMALKTMSTIRAEELFERVVAKGF